MSPLLSIIIPVYNAALTVERTLASLECIPEEDRPEVQVIVINDGSTDDSATLLRAGMEKLPGFAWDRVDQPNQGLSSARNAGLQRGRGKWVFFLDADDELTINPILILRKHPQRSALGFTVEYRRQGRRPWAPVRPASVRPHRHLDVLTARNPFQPSSLIFQRDRVDQLFDLKISVVNDWLFWMQNPRIFDDMLPLPEVMSALIHVHDRNMSSAYVQAGRYRAQVAQLILDAPGRRLTVWERNNLLVQRAIGILQQRFAGSLADYFRFPCDPLLYLKLLVYTAAALVNVPATPYRMKK
jgi:glycosyltransferase involved in cell wall biosynthesis